MMLATIGSDIRDRHAGEIINLQLKNHHMLDTVGNMSGKQSSGELRYHHEENDDEAAYGQEDASNDRYREENLNFVSDGNDTFMEDMMKTTAAKLTKDERKSAMHRQSNEQVGKILKPSTLYPAVYGATTLKTRNKGKHSIPWMNRGSRHDQSQPRSRINLQEEQQAGADSMTMGNGLGLGHLTLNATSNN